MSALIVRFTRLNPTRHRFEATRAGGTREVREFETRSLLLHDLVERLRQLQGQWRATPFGQTMELRFEV